MADEASVNSHPAADSERSPDTLRDPVRFFSATERAALYLAEDGRCAACGVALTPGFHADHRVPHSAGGMTDVRNGQALCAACDGAKGARDVGVAAAVGSVPLPPVTVQSARLWQQEALATWEGRRAESPNFTLVACPGAGKTKGACYIVRRALELGLAQRVVVVVPTTPLRRQWADAAAEFGLDLDPTWNNADGALPADAHGVVVTYAGVASLPSLLRRHTAVPTIAVLDEIHHCGDVADESGGPAWGRAVREALGGAAYRLVLSGTPFRTDGTRIPFVCYDGQNVVVADYTYRYEDALRDGVCRDVVFREFDGEMTWLSGGEEYCKRFGDELPARERGRRLRTALTAGEWLPDVLRHAHEDLRLIRAQGGAHARAGGLVLASDVRHAEQIRGILHAITGEVPTIAVTDPDDARASVKAHDAITAFRAGHTRWLVAVRMVSEGVDIPRLRVGVYATTALTDLAFRQAIGRFVRMQSDCGEDQHAIVYVPKDPRIDEMQASIRSEIIHQCLADLERAPMDDADGGAGDGTFEPSFFSPLDAVALEAGATLGDEFLTPEDLAFGNDVATRSGQPAHYLVFARARRILEGAQRGTAAASPFSPVEAPRYVRRARLRQSVVKLLRQLVKVHMGGEPEMFRALHHRLNEGAGVERITEATVEQLEQQLAMLRRWIAEGVPMAA